MQSLGPDGFFPSWQLPTKAGRNERDCGSGDAVGLKPPFCREQLLENRKRRLSTRLQLKARDCGSGETIGFTPQICGDLLLENRRLSVLLARGCGSCIIAVGTTSLLGREGPQPLGTSQRRLADLGDEVPAVRSLSRTVTSPPLPRPRPRAQSTTPSAASYSERLARSAPKPKRCKCFGGAGPQASTVSSP